MVRDEQKIWSKFAKIYDRFMKKDKFAYEEIITLIKKTTIPTDEILEIGTATGIISFGLSNYVNKIIATDFSPKMISIAKKKAHINNIHNINFEVQDVCKLTYEDNSFDKAIIANVLHIMPEPKKALAEIKRVLRTDGILYAPTFVHAGGKKAGVFSLLAGLIGFKVYSKWTEDKYHQFIEDNGFKIIDKSMIKASFPISFVSCKHV
ncbi:class I SAM-dependent methyltransferase [Clostridiaceae bacterium M8S5]|nr:class I SAM-dependent methyltransferase [Clostridiaceae bacterium M8S5]